MKTILSLTDVILSPANSGINSAKNPSVNNPEIFGGGGGGEKKFKIKIKKFKICRHEFIRAFFLCLKKLFVAAEYNSAFLFPIFNFTFLIFNCCKRG